MGNIKIKDKWLIVGICLTVAIFVVFMVVMGRGCMLNKPAEGTKVSDTAMQEPDTSDTITKELSAETTKETTTKETTVKETEVSVAEVYEELSALSEAVFGDYEHQTTNTLWNGDTTAKLMHPDQYEYMLMLSESWYEGKYTTDRVRDMAYNESPVKTNEDMYQLTGFYQAFIGDEALYKVVDVDIVRLEFEGRKTSISEDESYIRLVEADERSATPHFLFVKACYSQSKDITYVYYFDSEFQWTNNNFAFEEG